MASPKLVLLSSIVLAFSFAPVANADEKAAEREFTLKVLPLLKAKCFTCHGEGEKKPKGSLDMRSRAALLKGGDSGATFVSGKPDESLLYKAVKWDGIEMPPKENDRLSNQQVELVRNWIVAGAPWPDDAAQKRYRNEERKAVLTADGELVKTSGGLSDEWTYRRYQPEDLWAFRPVKKPAVPDAATNPVDYFHRMKLANAGTIPVSQADPHTLIRRATFDLLGLPPTPEEVERFLLQWRFDSAKAWNDLIDRLLASPQYGEHWAQHWFDVARYADTGGMANDFERSNMWRYRDYVIRSLNSDKPYDRFVMEQLAGDELADASALQRLNGDAAKVAALRQSGEYTEEEAEWVIATSFLRLGPWDNAMIMPPQARQIYLDDVVNSVGQTFLATTMRCFKCHDHKFDPLPTRDYYRVYAAFAGTQMAERPLRFTNSESRERFAEGKAFVERMLKHATAEKEKILAKQEAAAKKWYQEHKLPYKSEDARKNDPDDRKPPRHVGLDHVDEGQLKVREQDEWIWQRALERYQPMANAVYDGPDPPMAWNAARKLRMPPKINTNWKPDSHILLGGTLEAPGEPVKPGVLSAIGVPAADEEYVLPVEITKRRLALARWVTDPRNPLTSRAIVNRVWQYHFGKAIVSTPNNFGVKGAKPTHPQLLDWLAADFVENGWTLKRLHKLIMTSQAYQMGGGHPQIDALWTTDPNNDLLAFFPARRLTAEELRDAMLRVTGEINPAVGGLPIFPEMNLEAAFQPRMIQFSLAPAYQPSQTPEERNRRSIYAYRSRGLHDPFLEVFNQPNPNDSCDLRDTAAVSPQAFTLLNSTVMSDRSIAFALRLEKEAKSLDGQVSRAFQLSLNRLPTAAEAARMAKYVRKMQAYHRATKPGTVKYPTVLKRSLVEELSGKEFEYEEILPAFEKYVPDAKPADVSADTRALADLCLLLFNSHEFIHLN